MTRSVLCALTGVLSLSLCIVSTSFSETNPNVYVNGGYVFGEEFSYPRVSIGAGGQLIGLPDWLSFGIYGTGLQSGDVKKSSVSILVLDFSNLLLDEVTNHTRTTENKMGYGVELVITPLRHTHSNGLKTSLILTPYLGSTEVEIENKQVLYGLERLTSFASQTIALVMPLPPVTTTQKHTNWETTYGGKVSLQVSKDINVGCLKTIGLDLGGGYNKIDGQDSEVFGSSNLVLGF